MANSANINISVSGQVNGLNLSQAGNLSTIPSGSTALAESILITTGTWQLIITGSNFGTASSFTVFNTQTGSINLALSNSFSNTVNNLGTIPAMPSTTSFTGNNGNPTSIQWNNTFGGLYAQAVTNNSYGVFVIVPL